MALNNYVFATVKKIISTKSKDVIGYDSFLVLVEPYLSDALDICAISSHLRDVVQEGDLVVLDLGLVPIPNTTTPALKREIVAIIRNDTRKAIEVIYKDLGTRIKSKQVKTELAG